MSKKKSDLQKKQYYDAKTMLIKYVKRYGIIILISAPIIMFVTYILANEIEGFAGIPSFFASFAMLLLSLFVGIVVFSKIDSKREHQSTKESERDPFAD